MLGQTNFQNQISEKIKNQKQKLNWSDVKCQKSKIINLKP